MKKLFLLACVIIAFASCNPDRGADYVDDLDATVNVYDVQKEDLFSTYKNYVLSDTIVHIKNGDIDTTSHTYDDAILAQIRENLQAKGYTEIDVQSSTDSTDVDFIVSVSQIVDRQSGTYWWGYPGWGYYPGWNMGWGYPGYPGWYYPDMYYPTTYSYKTGTVLVEFSDFNDPQEVQDGSVDSDIFYPVYFTGASNGLVQGSDSYIENRIITGIDDMFAQSPFNN